MLGTAGAFRTLPIPRRRPITFFLVAWLLILVFFPSPPSNKFCLLSITTGSVETSEDQFVSVFCPPQVRPVVFCWGSTLELPVQQHWLFKCQMAATFLVPQGYGYLSLKSFLSALQELQFSQDIGGDSRSISVKYFDLHHNGGHSWSRGMPHGTNGACGGNIKSGTPIMWILLLTNLNFSSIYWDNFVKTYQMFTHHGLL